MAVNATIKNREVREVLEFMIKAVRYAGDNILLPERQKISASRCGNGLVFSEADLVKRNDTLAVDFVTDADKKSEQHILSEIDEKFKGLATVIGEENGRRLGPLIYSFVFYPLDGTAIFSGKMQDLLEKSKLERLIDNKYQTQFNVRVKETDFSKYTVHLAYIILDKNTLQNEAAVEAVYAPERKELFTAIKGEGVSYQKLSEDGQTDTVSRLSAQSKDFDNEIILADAFLPSMLSPAYLNRYNCLLKTLEKLKLPFRKFGYTSAVYESLATVFPSTHADRTNLYVNPHVCLWDVPALSVREAGGEAMVVSEQNGQYIFQPFDYTSFEINNRKSNLYKEPFFVIVGKKELVSDMVLHMKKLVSKVNQ
ncbi:hypothetical protein HZA96_01315 [Candidatus Woesearchaeota archaeon]|nr:hypothetical protein [Candidatus Woesearchaeota archaeon]